MATATFSPAMLTGVGSFSTATCGDAGDNVYTFKYSVSVSTTIQVTFALTGGTSQTVTHTSSGTFTKSISTTNTAPTATATFASGTGTIGLAGVEYSDASVTPDAPTINIYNTTSQGDYKLYVVITDPSHPYTIQSRTIEYINKDTGAASYRVITTGSVTLSPLSSYTTYKVRAKVADINGVESDYSSYSEKTTYSKPDTPAGSISTITTSSVVLVGDTYSNDDSSAHSSSNWIIRDNGDEVIYNSGGSSDLESTTISSGITANSDYSFSVSYRSANNVASDASNWYYFSTNESSASKAKASVFVQGTITAKSKGSTYIISDPDISRAKAKVFVSQRSTVQSKASVWVDSAPWAEETEQSTTWTEETV